MKQALKGALLIIVAMSLFGFIGIFVRFLTESYGLNILTLVFLLFIIPGIILSLFFLFKDKKTFIIPKKLVKFIVLFAVFDILNVFFYFQAFVNTTISNAVLTHYTMPIFVAILAPFLLKEYVNKKTLIGLIVGIIGIFFITSGNFSFQSGEFVGILYGIGSGLMYALVVILIRYLSRYISVYSMRIYQTLIGSVLLLPFMIKYSSFPNMQLNLSLVSLILFYSILIGVIAVLLHWSGIKRVTSHTAGVLGYFESLFAILFAFLFFREIPQISTIIGGTLIIYSGYLIIRRKE